MNKDTETIIWDFQEAIVDVYKNENLKCLGTLIDNNYLFEGQNFCAAFFDITRKGMIKYGEGLQKFELIDDLIFCSREIMYFTASMILYKPYINNPIEEGFMTSSGMLYPNNQNIPGIRYNMFSSIVCEKIYNYWDRIGDTIGLYFPDRIKKHRIYFSNVIDIIPEEYHSEESYKWLLNFKNTRFQELNKRRKQAVHYITEDTNFKYKHLNKSSDKTGMESLFNEKLNLTELYKEHIDDTITGLENTLRLIKKITEQTLKEME